ncbi:MAG: hypothetical protein KC423_12625 [Anaerolineales bacterium]|nr:hypothetical protein [Anaerolineales bacterium]
MKTKFQTPPIDWYHISLIRKMSVCEKNRQAFSAAEFALRQKRLLLRHQHPDWDAAMIDQTARRLVFTKDPRRK